MEPCNPLVGHSLRFIESTSHRQCLGPNEERPKNHLHERRPFEKAGTAFTKTDSIFDIELVDTREFLEGRTEWILPGDGYFNPEGNLAVAEFLSQNVLSHPSSLR